MTSSPGALPRSGHTGKGRRSCQADHTEALCSSPACSLWMREPKSLQRAGTGSLWYLQFAWVGRSTPTCRGCEHQHAGWTACPAALPSWWLHQREGLTHHQSWCEWCHRWKYPTSTESLVGSPSCRRSFSVYGTSLRLWCHWHTAPLCRQRPQPQQTWRLDGAHCHQHRVVLYWVYLYSATLCKISMRFTSIFPGYRTCSFQYQLNSLGMHTALLPSRRWKLFKHTSNHCPTKYPFTPGSRECTYRWSVLRKNTAPHRGGRDPYPRPFSPKSQAMVTAPWQPARTWSIYFRRIVVLKGHAWAQLSRPGQSKAWIARACWPTPAALRAVEPEPQTWPIIDESLWNENNKSSQDVDQPARAARGNTVHGLRCGQQECIATAVQSHLCGSGLICPWCWSQPHGEAHPLSHGCHQAAAPTHKLYPDRRLQPATGAPITIKWPTDTSGECPHSRLISAGQTVHRHASHLHQQPSVRSCGQGRP